MRYRAVLVTDAGGCVARQLTVSLLNAGHAVRGTLDHSEDPDRLRSIISQYAPVETLEYAAADFSADPGWARAMEGMEAVIIPASPLPAVVGHSRTALVQGAVSAILRVLNIARASGLTRIIVASSTSAIVGGHMRDAETGTRFNPFTEADWSDLASGRLSAGQEARTRAELAVWDFAMSFEEMGISVINAGKVFGPVIGEASPGGGTGLIRRLMAGEYRDLPRIGFEGIDVRDLADLYMRVLGNDLSIGNRYVATAGFLWLEDVAQLLSAEFEGHAERICRRTAPDIVLRLKAMFDDTASRAVPDLGQYSPCSPARAWQDLGWRPRPATDAIRSTAQSLIAAGLVE